MSDSEDSGFVFSPEARQDFLDAWDYIAQENIDAADRFSAAVYDAVQKLAVMPGMGHRRADLAPDPDLLFWPILRSHLIIYRASTRPLQVVRLLSGYRDLAPLLSA